MAIILDGSTGITVNKVAFDNSGVAGSASTPSIYPAGDTNTGFFFPAADTFAAATSGTERLRIDSSGNVKFAGSISVDDFQVGDTGANVAIGGTPTGNSAGRLKFINSNTQKNWQISTNDSVSGALEFTQSTAAGGSTFTTPAMVLDSSGKVGIGTSSPGYQLELYKNTANPELSLYNGGANERRFALGVLNGSGAASRLYINDNTAGVTRFAIDGTGNVGIGTTSPSRLLHLKSGAASTNKQMLFLEEATATYGWSFNIDDSASGDLYFRKVLAGTESTVATFITGGNVKFAGSISVGNATPAASGAGITFPATQSASSDANTLDDYEEGTWTPNVIHSGSNNSTWTTKNGYYTKVGRLVTAWFVCDGGTSGTAGTNLQVTGLPFALGTISGAITFGIWSTNGTVRTGGLNISSSGTTTMNMYNGGSPIIEQQSYASGCITYFA